MAKNKTKELKHLSDLTQDLRNANKGTQRGGGLLENSLQKYGAGRSILVDRNGNIIAGNKTAESAVSVGLSDDVLVVQSSGDKLVVVQRTDLDINDKAARELAIADNRISQVNLDFDVEVLASLVDEGVEIGDMFSDDEMTELLAGLESDIGDGVDTEEIRGKLTDKFIIPPFSIFDTRQGYWRNRAAMWDKTIGNVKATREGALDSLAPLTGDSNYGFTEAESFKDNVSQLDPVLCEISYKWFMPDDGKMILNPFGGEPVSAIVAAELGLQYTGIELRQDQVEQTEAAAARLDLSDNVNMICGDATQSDQILKGKEPCDLIFSSPPFYDLEVYSDNQEDLSNIGTYGEFMEGMFEAFSGATKHLRSNRFAVINVTEIRDKAGIYRGFVPDTIRMMERCGLSFYNDIILVNAIGTAVLRGAKYMNSRKVVRVHQNVLVFYKGNPKDIKKYFSKIEVMTEEPDGL